MITRPAKSTYNVFTGLGTRHLKLSTGNVMVAIYPLFPCLLDGGLVLTTPQGTEDLQGACLLLCTFRAKQHHLAVK